MTNLAGKIALITGSARGIGRAIAERYGSLGTRVVVNYSTDSRRASEAVATMRHRHDRAPRRAAIAVQADVSNMAKVARLFETGVERFGHIDIVVANAGGN
jgi:3-oxoacyl-[acyl-carrier protein] reductase